MGPAADVLPHLPVPKFAKLAPVPNVAPPIAKGIPPGLALPAFHEGLRPVGFPPAFSGRFAPPEEVGACLQSLALVSDPSFGCLGDSASWIHGLAGFDVLHRLSAKPGDFVEFLVYDHGGMPSATSIVRMTLQWLGNATG